MGAALIRTALTDAQWEHSPGTFLAGNVFPVAPGPILAFLCGGAVDCAHRLPMAQSSVGIRGLQHRLQPFPQMGEG